ncbi:MAG: GGDEF domain-containing protein [Candidatus Omnitrophota bacterium]
MRRIIIFFVAVLIAVISHVQAAKSGAYPASLNLLALAVLFAGAYENFWFSVVLGIFSSIAAASLLLFGVPPLAVLISFLGFTLLLHVVYWIKKTSGIIERSLAARYKDREASYELLKHDRDQIKNLNNRIEMQVAEIARLYDVTKELSATLEFNEMLNVLCNFMTKNFSYTSAYLLIARREGASFNIEQRFEFKKTCVKRDTQVAYEKELLDLLVSHKMHVAIPSPQEMFYREKMKLLRSVHTFMAVPIAFGAKTSYVLVLENLPEGEFERFLVLGGQLSLQLGKVNLYGEVQELAIVDGLTGVFVRRHFMERLSEELARSLRHGSGLSLLLLDIDYFKKLNDTFGHLVGDAVLKQTADILKRNIREVDFIGRYGGEEFAIALTDTAKADAYQVGERIRQAVDAYQFRAYDETLKTTISIGICTSPSDGSKMEDLIERSDEALYHSKGSGRNKVSVF